MSRAEDRMELGTVTTFRLDKALSKRLDAICAIDGSTKDAVIRRLLSYGLLVQHHLQFMLPAAVDTIAKHESAARRRKSA